MSTKDHTGGEPVNAPIFPKPPVVLLLFLAAGFALQHFVPLLSGEPDVVSVVAGNALMVAGFVIAMFAAREMFRARTAILPGEKATALVQSGIFSLSRNPLYLTFMFFMVGLGLALANLWLILLAPLLLLYMQERVVKREEAYLAARFGPQFIEYRKRVRRWL
ncbi:isoprenylcysteine carboxylmethyltransferase family protein [Rhodomicrobium sp. Az07]|uniref:methyltransferase family protein n=1 Tax=Rhodomicrobium sp. Az07 TaxID=2839034 RepID=UPI001BE90B8F|nr:isoprenylcysteine carboxylmethyltransferase family protein [Rhodomicrobium sp. Az07]MBT3069272.1 isoprenylcysteine carboxylmethyltransferase family protein [Rhodomicrobium sp. Az07]